MCVFPKPVTKKNYTELGVMGKVIRKLYAIIKMSNKMSFNILLQPSPPQSVKTVKILSAFCNKPAMLLLN